MTRAVSHDSSVLYVLPWPRTRFRYAIAILTIRASVLPLASRVLLSLVLGEHPVMRIKNQRYIEPEKRLWEQRDDTHN